MIFVVLGLAFADSAKHYLELLCNAAKVAGPFLIQYPLYAGLMGLIAESGLGALIVGGFVQVATAETLSLWTFFSAAFLNLFIPSAGGQWAVQGPIVIEAASQLGADLPRIAMSVTVGEVWTNCVQPLFRGTGTRDCRLTYPGHHGLLFDCVVDVGTHLSCGVSGFLGVDACGSEQPVRLSNAPFVNGRGSFK